MIFVALATAAANTNQDQQSKYVLRKVLATGSGLIQTNVSQMKGSVQPGFWLKQVLANFWSAKKRVFQENARFGQFMVLGGSRCPPKTLI